MMKKTLSAALASVVVTGAALLAACNGARDTALQLGSMSDGTGFVTKTLSTGSEPRKYAVFIPRHYDTSKKYPMIVFLHGIGESGSDLSGPMRVGLAPFVADKADSFPFIVLIPQSHGNWNEDSVDTSDMMAAIVEVEKAYAVDTDRVSLTGLSTGGYGTFAIGAKYNQYFAALVPMAPSGGAGHYAATLAKMPIWAFENTADPFVMPGSMSGTLSAIESAGGKPKHTVYGAFGHDCWERAYAQGDIFEWLLQQKRSARMAGAAAPIVPTLAKSNGGARTVVIDDAGVKAFGF